jgi:hypothetical protein
MGRTVLGMFIEERDQMVDLAYGMVAVWLAGNLFLVALAFNDCRLILNNLAPGVDPWTFDGYWGFGRRPPVYKIDPALLNPDGRVFRERAIRHGRYFAIWCVGGFILTVCMFTYLKAS